MFFLIKSIKIVVVYNQEFYQLKKVVNHSKKTKNKYSNTQILKIFTILISS